MPTDIKFQLIQVAIEHLTLIITIFFALAAAVAVYLKPRLPAAVQNSQALLSFLAAARTVMINVAASLQDEANTAHVAYDLAVKAANGDAALIESAKDVRDATLNGLRNRAVSLAKDQLRNCIPSWMIDASAHLYAILEAVLPEVKSLFPKRS